MFVCMRLPGLDHTPLYFTTRYCFLALSSTTMRLKWWPRHTVTSCPHTPFLCWHLWWWAGPPWVALQHYGLLFDPFHITAELQRSHFPAGIPQKAASMWGLLSNQMDKNHNSSHSEYPGSERRAGFGSPVGKRSSGFAVVQPPRRTVWHPETPHAEGT